MADPENRAPGADSAGTPGTPPSDGTPSGDERPPLRRRSELRRRLALLVLVVGIAGLVAYWSRSRPVDVLVIYDFGPHARRVTRVELSYEREGAAAHPVTLDFPSEAGAPKRWRHTLRLHPGRYVVRARVHLGPGAGREGEVKRHTRHVTVKSGEEQRLVLRLAR